MVEKKVVLKTIKKMVDSGISEKVIKSTLKEVGLDEKEISDYLSEVQESKPVPAEPEKPVSPSPEAEKAIAEREAQEMRETTTHIKMEEHGAALDEVNEKLFSIQRKLGIMASHEFDGSDLKEKLGLLEGQVKEMKKDLSEVKALSSALNSLLKRVLETDREILTKLSKKR